MRLEAVIFDMDGVLVDTETADFQAWQELFDAHGHALSLEEYCDHAGQYGSWDRLYALLSDGCGRSPADLHADRGPRFQALVAERLRPEPALTRLLAEIRAAELRSGVATASDREWVEYLLAGIGLEAEFHAVVTGDDVARRKPAPDAYLAVVEALGVAPAACVALEDSRTGIEAARSAGLRVVAVPNAISRAQDLSAAHQRVEGLHEVTLALLRELIES